MFLIKIQLMIEYNFWELSKFLHKVRIMKFLLSLMLACSFFCQNSCWAHQNRTPTINWLTNYEEAVKQSKEQAKPLLLFFTGTGWCPACAKLEEEVLHTYEFAESSGNQFIFMKLDFPQDKNFADPQTSSQNRLLLKKFDVRSFPTIILFDAQNQRQIGITGYRPGGARQYSNHLNNMVNDYSNYNQKIQKMDNHQLSGIELKQLYEKAKEFDLENDLPIIIKSGVNSDLKTFFLLERYRLLSDEGMAHTKEAQALKHQLLTSDPTNGSKIHYEIAVIDFEAYSEEKDHYSAAHAAAPLIEYVEKFGKTDKENLWRLHMIISQVFLDENLLKEALNYAESSYECAPSTTRPDIAVVIKNIQAQMQKL